MDKGHEAAVDVSRRVTLVGQPASTDVHDDPVSAQSQRVTGLTLALVMEHHGVSELGDVYVARLLVHEMVLVKRMLSRMK